MLGHQNESEQIVTPFHSETCTPSRSNLPYSTGDQEGCTVQKHTLNKVQET